MRWERRPPPAPCSKLWGGGGAKAQSPQTVWYQDSFGNIVPAGAGTLALGITPPPLPPNAQIPGQPPGPQSHKGPHGPVHTADIEGSRQHPHGRIRPEDAGGDQCPTSSDSYYTTGFPKYNILMIMVDQMRNPNFWPPSSGSILGSSGPIPNISNLMGTSYTFPNYFVTATVCGPSRACIQTGLYTQQNCIFRSRKIGASNTALSDPDFGPDAGQTATAPPLLPWYGSNWVSGNPPGFPAIGNVLSQVLPVGSPTSGACTSYDCTWIGKWHLSCSTALGSSDGPGFNGPSDYGYNGFVGGKYNIPTTLPNNPYLRGQQIQQGYPSPDGLSQEGNSGDFLDSFTQATGIPAQTSAHDVPSFAMPPTTPLVAPASFVGLNDAAIADAFGKWLTNMNGQASPPNWFCAVSFINPHDMSDFPYTFGLTSGDTTCPIPTGNTEAYCAPPSNSAPSQGFQPPPSSLTSPTPYNGTDCLNGTPTACAADGDVTTIAAVPTSYASNLPSNWNWEDQSGTPYSTIGSNPNLKPGLQQFFQTQRNNVSGGVADPRVQPLGWQTFLNYYLWLESCVDIQIGRVLGSPTIPGGLYNSNFWNNTVIVFTADHGDYAGSHGIQAKGGALYEEVINVPLFISFPECRPNWPSPPTTGAPPALPYVCSAVDILPFLYTLALGNHTWRTNPSDIVYYLKGREAIMDAIMYYNGQPGTVQPIQQRRISGVPLHTPLVENPTLPWHMYQPFVLHTADDYSIAEDNNGFLRPSHAIAFRTVDQTDPITNPANGATLYGGGKLGVYSYWNTCTPTNAPIIGLGAPGIPNQPPTECELYNYSPHPPGMDTPPPPVNVQEMGNTFLDNSAPNELALYVNDFFHLGSPAGINVQAELYHNSGVTPGPQVTAAIQTAFNNYILYLKCTGQLSKADGTPAQTPGKSTCPAQGCPNCSGSGSCPPVYSA